MAIDYERLRSITVNALPQFESSQFANLVEYIERQNPDLVQASHRQMMAGISSFSQERLDGHREMIRQILHELYIEGVIVMGVDAANPNWPFFRVTEHGKKALAQTAPTPYDPDGFLDAFTRAVPGVDGVIVMYLTESLLGFRRGCYLSSTVMLGCASEKCLLVLIDEMAGAMTAPARKASFEKRTHEKFIKTQFTELQKELASIKLPKAITDNLDVQLNGIFSLIRTYRNDVGHPSGRTIPRETAHANLLLFPTYVKTAYGLMAHFKSNPIT